MAKSALILTSALLVVALAACQKAQEAPADEAASQMAEVAAAPEPDMAGSSKSVELMEVSEEPAVEMPSARVSEDQLVSSAATYTDNERKFVRTANARFRVKDVYQSAMAIENIVASQGGFVTKNEISSQIDNVRRYPKSNKILIEFTEYTVQGNMSVRVPSAKTQDFLRAIASQMEFLNNRNFAAQDVQFDLLRQQLEYQRNNETQKQLGDISESPGKVADRANVVTSQRDAKAERDEATVKRKEVEDKVSFSTIDFSLYQQSKVQQTEVPNVDAMIQANRPGFFSQLGDAMSAGWQGFLSLIIALSTLWPLWIFFALVVYGFSRLFRRKKPA